LFRESTLKQWLDMILTYIDVNVDDFRVKDIAYISKYIAQLDKYNNSINDLKKDYHIELHRLECKEVIDTVKNTIRDVKNEFRRMLPELITQMC
jgi:hypothetical protein